MRWIWVRLRCRSRSTSRLRPAMARTTAPSPNRSEAPTRSWSAWRCATCSSAPWSTSPRASARSWPCGFTSRCRSPKLRAASASARCMSRDCSARPSSSSRNTCQKKARRRNVPLFESRAPSDPLILFRRWYREAERAGAPQPDAMTLATTSASGPSARMVLFKGIEYGAFLFYSNHGSRKGTDLSGDPRAALVFYWYVTHHQVRVSGSVRRVSRRASEKYFATRPRGAQLSALASRQSRVVLSRDVLERAVVELAVKFPDRVPLPADWGGYALRPRGDRVLGEPGGPPPRPPALRP